MKNRILVFCSLIIILLAISYASAKIQTTVNLVDSGKDGFNNIKEGDRLSLIYDFSTGEEIKRNIEISSEDSLDLSKELFCYENCNIVPKRIITKTSIKDGSEILSIINQDINGNNHNQIVDIYLGDKMPFEDSSSQIEQGKYYDNQDVIISWYGNITTYDDGNYDFYLDTTGKILSITVNNEIKKIAENNQESEFNLDLKEGENQIEIIYSANKSNEINLYWKKNNDKFSIIPDSDLSFISGSIVESESSQLKSKSFSASQFPSSYQIDYSVYPTAVKGYHSITNGRTPILLVHGLHGSDNIDTSDTSTWTYWNSIPTKLKDKNKDVWVLFYTPANVSNYLTAGLLKNEINNVLSYYSTSKLDVVSHSMGGLVTFGYLENLGKDQFGNKVSYDNNIRKYIAISPVTHGSFSANRMILNENIASTGCNWLANAFGKGSDRDAQAYLDLAVGSEYSWILNEESLPQDISYLIITGNEGIDCVPDETKESNSGDPGAGNDGLIAVASASRLDKNIPLVILGNYNHANEIGTDQTGIFKLTPVREINVMNAFINGESVNTIKSFFNSGDYYISPNDPSSNPFNKGSVVLKINSQLSVNSVKLRDSSGEYLYLTKFKDLRHNTQTNNWFYFSNDDLNMGYSNQKYGLTIPKGTYDVYVNEADTGQDVEIKGAQTTMKEIDITPQNFCNSGSCCNLSTNTIKPSNSQPTGYTDYYTCNGQQRNFIDYYCDGNSPDSVYFSTSTIEICSQEYYCSNVGCILNISFVDPDNDGINNILDNCPNIYNPLQENFDNDQYGDACDSDKDNDGFCEKGEDARNSTICFREISEEGTDCNDFNSSTFPPYSDAVIIEDTVFCSGEYNLSSSGIRISKNDIKILCNNTTISNNGFWGYTLNNLTIQNCTIKNSYRSFQFPQLSNSRFINNKIIHDKLEQFSRGFWIASGSNNEFLGNNVSETYFGFDIESINQSLFEDNYVIGGGVAFMLDKSVNNNISKNTIINTSSGISLEDSKNNNIMNNFAKGIFSGSGISLVKNSSNNVINFNNLSNYSGGISISDSNGNNVRDNYLKDQSSFAIIISNSANNTIISNLLDGYQRLQGFDYSIYDTDDDKNIYCLEDFSNEYLNGATGPTCEIACSTDLDCDDSDQYTQDYCILPGEYDSYCYYESVNCINDLDCGVNGFVDSLYCSGKDVVQNFQNFTCLNPGTVDSSCEIEVSPIISESCSDSCFNGQCVEITCSSNSDCNDFDSYTQDTCINPGETNSVCQYENIECLSDSDCNDINPETTDICHNPGTPQSSCENIEPEPTPKLTINLPIPRNYSDRRILFDISVSDEVDEITYVDNLDSRPRDRRLCSNCDLYDRERSFRDGNHNVTFKAWKNDEVVDQESVEFLVDSKDPRISKTEPRRGFSNGEFFVEFREDNPTLLTLFYGTNSDRRTVNLEESDCHEERRNTACSKEVDVSDFDGQEINYWFELTDVAGNTDISRAYDLSVDITPPVVNNPDDFLTNDDRYLYFNLDLTEENFEEVSYSYIDNRGRLKERRLCSRLRDGICEDKERIRDDYDYQSVNVYDEAGNSVGLPISI